MFTKSNLLDNGEVALVQFANKGSLNCINILTNVSRVFLYWSIINETNIIFGGHAFLL